MMEDYKVIERGKITYYVGKNSILVSVGGNQYISYNVYNTPNKSGITDFRNAILKSKPGQYDNVVDQMDLARKCNVIGTGTRKPSWLEK